MISPKREAQLKAAFRREMKRQLPGFFMFAYATAGAPDISIVGNGVQTNWECKHATPSFVSHGIQALFAARIAEAAHCRYIIWQQWGLDLKKRTLIVHPRAIHMGTWQDEFEAECDGFNMKWLVQQVRKAHGLA